MFFHSFYVFYFIAPSSAPTSVNISDMTATNITVQWEPVNCIDRNGNITSYALRYRVQNTTVFQTLVVPKVYRAVLSNLKSSTSYEIEVAAVNSAGRGVYSSITVGNTIGKPSFEAADFRKSQCCM